MNHSSGAAAVPGKSEIGMMAVLLSRRYGKRGGEVAMHFANEHAAIGDTTRANVWREVAARLTASAVAPTLS